MIYFLAEQAMEEEALLAVAVAQQENALFVSPVTAWEAALLLEKPPEKRPDLQGQAAAAWFDRGRRLMGARLATISVPVTLEAASIPGRFGHRDPADCFIMATARVRGLALATRDRVMRRLAQGPYPELSVVVC